jgi:predicted membrane protein (TIGR00267 family)
MRMPETGPALRRYFVNTVFDSTFVIMGVIIGSAFSGIGSRDVVIGIILTSSVALGISTGVSVYEAETLEQERRIREIERAMLSSMRDTDIKSASRVSILFISLVNFSAPLITCAITLTPFLLLSSESLEVMAYIGLALALCILFVTGAVMGKMGQHNPLIKGARMAVIGFLAFLICFWIESLI